MRKIKKYKKDLLSSLFLYIFIEQSDIIDILKRYRFRELTELTDQLFK